MKKDTTVVLSFFPNAIGFGYVCLETPQKLLKSGIIKVRPICNGPILKQVKELVELFNPTIVIVRDFDSNPPHRNKRVQQAISGITTYAKEQHIPIYRYSRQQIRDVFEQFGATSKYEISKKIIEWFPVLADLAPVKRKPWVPEDYQYGIFDALALAITHQYLNE